MFKFEYLNFKLKIGLLSDTHSYLDQRILDHLDQCDEIWHAGDIGKIEVLDRLQSHKPTRAVWGNIDDHEVRAASPKDNIFTADQLKVWITHIGGYPPKYYPAIRKKLAKEKVGLFICGHSHILKVMYDKEFGLLHMNPGAAGVHGFHKVRTMLRFEINAGKVENAEVIELGDRNGKNNIIKTF
jgi:hypothetical protein